MLGRRRGRWAYITTTLGKGPDCRIDQWAVPAEKLMTMQTLALALTLDYNAEIFLYKPWRPEGFFNLKIA